MIQERDIALNVILTIITCGIYGLVWYVQLTDDAGTINDDPDWTGGKAIVFTLLTCGIYGIYWHYKMGKEIYEAQQAKGINATDNSVLYLLLRLFGLSIVNICLMQNDLNELANK